MIYGNDVLNESYITEEQMIDNMITESINMSYNIVMNHADLLIERRLENINESVMDKVKTVLGYIKKGIDKLREFLKNTAKIVIATYAELLSYIPPLFKHTALFDGTYIEPKKGADKILESVPKSIMNKIHEYYSKSEEDLEKMLDVEKIKKSADEMIFNIVKPFQPHLQVAKGADARMMIEEVVEEMVPIGLWLQGLKSRIKKYTVMTQKIQKVGDELCKSYNDDISKIDNMINAEHDENSSAEKVRKESLILDLIKAEYGALFYVAGIIGRAQYNVFMLCAKKNQEILTNMQKNLKEERFKSKDKYDKWTKEEEARQYEEFKKRYKK